MAIRSPDDCEHTASAGTVGAVRFETVRVVDAMRVAS